MIFYLQHAKPKSKSTLSSLLVKTGEETGALDGFHTIFMLESALRMRYVAVTVEIDIKMAADH